MPQENFIHHLLDHTYIFNIKKKKKENAVEEP